MIAFVWFTFKDDGDCLVESVLSVRRIYGEQVPVCVFDDTNSPISSHVLQMIRPTLYELTSWDRGGNLNGAIAVAGILDCMRRAADITRADWVSKIDSDTILIRPWLDDDFRWAYQGICLCADNLAYGLNYILRRDAPDKMLKMIAGRHCMFDGPTKEDNTIALLATVCFPGGILIHDSAWGYPGQRMAAGWHYDPVIASTPEDCRDFALITFGNRYTMSDLTIEERNGSRARARVAVTMERFNEWIRVNLDV